MTSPKWRLNLLWYGEVRNAIPMDDARHVIDNRSRLSCINREGRCVHSAHDTCFIISDMRRLANPARTRHRGIPL